MQTNASAKTDTFSLPGEDGDKITPVNQEGVVSDDDAGESPALMLDKNFAMLAQESMKLDSEYEEGSSIQAEFFDFNKPGQKLNVILMGEHSYFKGGEKKPSIMFMHQGKLYQHGSNVLIDEVRKENLSVGQKLCIHYIGEQKTRTGGRTYKKFKIYFLRLKQS